jgi:hypothetical protein
LLYDGSSYGTSLVGYQTGLKSYSIVPDGRAGTATVTIALSRTGQSFTKTMTFYAAAAATNTLVATVRHPVLQIGTNTDAVQVAVKDAGGNAYSGTVTLFAVAAADALVAGSTTVSGTCTWTASVQAHRCSVTGVAPGTAKLKAYNASTVALSTASSNEVTVTVSNSTAATAKIALIRQPMLQTSEQLLLCLCLTQPVNHFLPKHLGTCLQQVVLLLHQV